MKCFYKNEIADMAGVSPRTFRRWLKSHRDTLASLGCHPNDKFLSPRALEYVCREYGIDIADAR